MIYCNDNEAILFKREIRIKGEMKTTSRRVGGFH